MDYLELKKLLEANRSYRMFDQSKKYDSKEFEEIIELATLCASGRNLQPLKYVVLNTASDCARIFPLLGWAGYLKDWNGPAEGSRPSAYIIQCLDTNLTANPMCDEGLQLEAITLGAVSKGMGTCIIKSFNPEKISETLNLPPHLKPTHVVALGKPVENIFLEPMKDGKIEYWRDQNGGHHVPKRGLDEILVK